MKPLPRNSINLATNDTLPLGIVSRGKHRPYFGGGRDRLCKTDETVRLNAKITKTAKKDFNEAVKKLHAGKGPCLVLRALVEGYIARTIVVTRTEFKCNGFKFPPGVSTGMINTLVPSRIKEHFDEAVLTYNPEAEPADIVRELARLYAAGKIRDLRVPEPGRM